MLPHTIKTAIEKNWPVVLPVGVLEYHGEHLAVGMDTLAVIKTLDILERAGMADYYGQQKGGNDPFNWIKNHPLMTDETIRNYPFDHAGVGETSLMLALCPEAVDMAHLSADAWYARDAAGASAELGMRGRDLKEYFLGAKQ